MIFDTVENYRRYLGLSKNMDRALEYLAAADFTGLADGRYPVDGDRVFALVQTPQTRPRRQGRWEAHRNYIDIQVMLDGSEIIGGRNLRGMEEETPYSAEGDIAFYRGGGGAFLPLENGTFAVFFPWDAHMPLIAPGEPKAVRKVVVKVLAEEDLRPEQGGN